MQHLHQEHLQPLEDVFKARPTNMLKDHLQHLHVGHLQLLKCHLEELLEDQLKDLLRDLLQDVVNILQRFVDDYYTSTCASSFFLMALSKLDVRTCDLIGCDVT
jgi:hypothetical protein